MPRMGTYCLARVLKSGNATSEKLCAVIENPAIIPSGKSKWTILDGNGYDSRDKIPFYFGKLTKFHPEGDVGIANLVEKKKENKIEPNMIASESPFVYIPSMSAIAFLEVGTSIPRSKFFKVFPEIYTETIDEILDSIELEIISDLRSFLEKLEAFDSIEQIEARVYPPNPLFGFLWKRLRKHLEERNAKTLFISETGKSGGVNTDLQNLVSNVVEGKIEGLVAQGMEPSIADAAILMAADGYGSGLVLGIEDGTPTRLSTKDTSRNFKCPSNPEPDLLFNTAYAILRRIEEQRKMEHP